MNLFLNAILESGTIILFNDEKEIINSKEIKTLGNESEKLLGFLDEFLLENNVNYDDLKNIVVVAGPGSFTGIRTISLLVNTINFVTKNNITGISFFDLYNDYPIVKASSKRDSFFKKSQNGEIEILKNEEVINYLQENKIEKLFGENKNLNLDDIQIFENINYSAIIKNIVFKQDKRINPIYIKKPSIS